MGLVAQELNRYYCKESGRCCKAPTCKQAATEEIVALHKRKMCVIKYVPNTPSCFKEK